MPAEWDLRAYRLAHDKLLSFVGSDNKALCKQIVAATDDELDMARSVAPR